MAWKKTYLTFNRQCSMGQSSVYILKKSSVYILNIIDLQVQSAVLDRTVSLSSSIALTNIEQDRIEWESLAITFAEILQAIQNHLKVLAVIPSSISRCKRKILRTGNPGRPQFYLSPETLEDLLGLGSSLAKISW